MVREMEQRAPEVTAFRSTYQPQKNKVAAYDYTVQLNIFQSLPRVLWLLLYFTTFGKVPLNRKQSDTNTEGD